MKKLLNILLAMAVFLSLVACGGSDGGNDAGSESAAWEQPDRLVYPYGIEKRPMQEQGTYEYKTICNTAPDLTTNGYVHIYDYSVEPAGDGMVDKTVKAMFIFNDDNSWYNGMKFDVLYADISGDGIFTGAEDWTVISDGVECPVTVLQDEFISGEWTPMGNFVSKYVLTIRTPENYDDIGLFFYNSDNRLKVEDRDGNIPNGTLLTELIDSDSQWFVMGGIGDDWEETHTPTYFGISYDSQPDIISVEDILGGIPVFDVEEPYDGEAPPVFPDAKPTVEIQGWSPDTINGEDVTEVNLDVVTYNWEDGYNLHYNIYADNSSDCIVTGGYNIEGGEYTVAEHGMSFDLYPDELDWAASVCFEFVMTDADGNSLSTAKMDIPVVYESQEIPEEDEENDENIYVDINDGLPLGVEITGWMPNVLDSTAGYTCTNLLYTVHGAEYEYNIIFRSTDNNGVIQEMNFPLESDTGSVSFDIIGTEIAGESVLFEIIIIDKDGTQLTSAKMDIPVE